MLSDHDTPEGRTYTMARCATTMQLSEEEMAARCRALASPLYEKALASVMKKLDKVPR